MDYIIKHSEQQISQRKLENYLKFTKIIQWGR